MSIKAKLAKAKEMLERIDAWLEDGPVENFGEVSAYVDGVIDLVTDVELRIEIRNVLKGIEEA